MAFAFGVSNAVFANPGGGTPNKVKGKVAGINNLPGTGNNRGFHSAAISSAKKISTMSSIMKR